MRKLPLLLLGLAALAACGRDEQPAAEPKPTLTYSGGAPRGATQTATATATTATTTAAEAAPPDTSVGAKMPVFAAQTLDGHPFDFVKERGNDVVFLNVWATWCGPCIGEMPDLMKMHDRYKAQGFKVVGISIDDSGADPVKAFLKEHQVSYPIAIDPESHVANVLQTTVLPTSVLLDRTGTIVWRHFGSVKLDDAELVKALNAALAQKQG